MPFDLPWSSPEHSRTVSRLDFNVFHMSFNTSIPRSLRAIKDLCQVSTMQRVCCRICRNHGSLATADATSGKLCQESKMMPGARNSVSSGSEIVSIWIKLSFIAVPSLESLPCLLSPIWKCQNLVPLVNIKIAGKWMFIPLKMVLIGINRYWSIPILFSGDLLKIC